MESFVKRLFKNIQRWEEENLAYNLKKIYTLLELEHLIDTF